MIKLAIDGKEYWSGTVCKPHDCHGNMLSFLAAADGSRAAALIAIEGQIQSFGQQSPGEFALLDRLLRLEYRGQINMNAQEQTTAQKIVSSNGSYVDPETTNAQASASKSGRWFNIKGIRLGMILEFLPLQYDGLPVAIPQGNPAARVVRRCNGQQPYVECTTVSFDATGHTEMSVYGVAVNGLRMDYTDVRAAKLAFTEKYGPPAFMHDFGDTMIMQWGGSQDYTNFSMLGDPGILVDNPIGNFIQTTPSDQDMLIVHLNSWFVADNATIPTGYHVFANYMMIDVPAAIKVRAASDNSLTNQQKDREQMEFRAVNKPRL